MATKTNTATKPAAANNDEMVTLTSRNGHGISRSAFTMPAYKVDAAARIGAKLHAEMLASDRS